MVFHIIVIYNLVMLVQLDESPICYLASLICQMHLYPHIQVCVKTKTNIKLSLLHKYFFFLILLYSRSEKKKNKLEEPRHNFCFSQSFFVNKYWNPKCTSYHKNPEQSVWQSYLKKCTHFRKKKRFEPQMVSNTFPFILVKILLIIQSHFNPDQD